MRCEAQNIWIRFSFCALLLSCFLLTGSSLHGIAASGKVRGHTVRQISIYMARQAETDLEVTGMIAGLPADSVGYVTRKELSALPAVTFEIRGDENFSEIRENRSVRVTGVPLDTVARALGAFQDSDLIDATCTDNYRGHYPASYIAAHHPVLALTINRMTPAQWAAEDHAENLGPYFITHDHYMPAFKILAHADRAQVPANVVRLNFSSTAATFGAIAPRGSFKAGSPEAQGFAIARQNCLRCHNQGQFGGSKAGRSWNVLSTWAREQPAYFSAYVRNPKSFEAHAKMPGNPEYDAATLAALTAYFRTFTMPGTLPGNAH